MEDMQQAKKLQQESCLFFYFVAKNLSENTFL